MDFNILAAEIERGEYTGLTDAECADLLNARTVEAVRRVPIPELTSLAYSMGLVVRLRVAIRTPDAPVELVAVCESLLDLLKAPFPEIDVYAPDGTPDLATAAMLGALAQAAMLSESEQAAIMALGKHTISRAEQLGIGMVAVGDVQRVRAGGS
jgi:hypothetical protein